MTSADGRGSPKRVDERDQLIQVIDAFLTNSTGKRGLPQDVRAAARG